LLQSAPPIQIQKQPRNSVRQRYELSDNLTANHSHLNRPAHVVGLENNAIRV
jgi:hypothetical protein